MSFADIFNSMIEKSTEGVGNGHQTNSNMSLDHLFKFPSKGSDRTSLHWVKVRFMQWEDENFFKGGVAKIRSHGYFNQSEQKGVTYDCARNYNQDCPICTMQRLDWNAEMNANGNNKDKVTPFVKQSFSKDDTFMWMYIVEASEKMKDWEGRVVLYKLPKSIENLVHNLKDAKYCEQREIPMANVVDVTKGAVVKLIMDCSVTENNKLYDTSHLVKESVNTPFFAKEDGSFDYDKTMATFEKILPNETNSAFFFGWRIIGNELTPEGLAHAYNSYSSKNTQYRYRHEHPLFMNASADASTIQSNNNGATHNDFGNAMQNPQPQAQQAQQAPQQASQPMTFDDFDDDIPF